MIPAAIYAPAGPEPGVGPRAATPLVFKCVTFHCSKLLPIARCPSTAEYVCAPLGRRHHQHRALNRPSFKQHQGLPARDWPCICYQSSRPGDTLVFSFPLSIHSFKSQPSVLIRTIPNPQETLRAKCTRSKLANPPHTKFSFSLSVRSFSQQFLSYLQPLPVEKVLS